MIFRVTVTELLYYMLQNQFSVARKMIKHDTYLSSARGLYFVYELTIS